MIFFLTNFLTKQTKNIKQTAKTRTLTKMPFVMNQDIPETYEELKKAFIAECKERYENNNTSIQLIREQGDEIAELKAEIANLEREKEAIEELAEEYCWTEEEVNRLKEENRVLKSYNYKLFEGEGV